MDKSRLIEKHNGMYIIRQQMPYPLKENNAYLAETDNGWAVVDLGIDIPETRELWKEALKRAGIDYSSITKIIITHCHPDHLGAAEWMQRETEAPVYMSETDWKIASEFVFLKGDRYTAYEKAIRESAANADFGEEKVRRLITDWCDKVLPLFPEPYIIETLSEDEEIILNGSMYHVKNLPGHTDGQIILWCKDNRTLFSGDIFAEKGYLHFTDWPNTRNSNPLMDFLHSLEVIEEMNPGIIYPGHGKPVTLYHEVFSKLRHRHSKLLSIFENSLPGPATAGELYEKVFPVPQTGEFADYIHHHRVLLGETIGYLNYLVSTGKLSSRLDGKKKIYSPSSGAR